jgi:hypothetical protein
LDKKHESYEPWEFGGWIHDPLAVSQVAELQPEPRFGDTPAGMDNTPLPDHVFLWDAARKVLGHLLPPRSQGSIGTCVSFGTARAVELTMLCEIAAGEHEHFREVCTEPIYGGSRVEIGKGRLGRGDGSIGAWAAEFVKSYGIMERAVHGSYDLSEYSVELSRKWGNAGIPADIEDLSRLHPIRAITEINSWEEAKRALASGYGISVCSNQGFSMDRDRDGFARPRGRWAHCMALTGYQTGRREGGRLDNSWGPSVHTGPVGAGDPGPEGFWADADVIDEMLSQNDSWAFSAFDGFPSHPTKSIDWTKCV